MTRSGGGARLVERGLLLLSHAYHKIHHRIHVHLNMRFHGSDLLLPTPGGQLKTWATTIETDLEPLF